jgi:DNA polymerase III subunit gamma/tau
VLSRCLQFNLRPMAPQTVAAHLSAVLQAESVTAEPGAIRQLSRAARGSMRDALSLTDQAIAFGGGTLEEAAVRAMLGSVDRRHAQRLVASLAARDGRAVLAECDALRSQGLSAAGTLEEMARLLQQMAVEQAVPGALDETDPDSEAARRMAPLLAPDETQLLYSICLQGRAELSLAPDEYAGLVMVLLRFMAFPGAEGTPGVAGPRSAGHESVTEAARLAQPGAMAASVAAPATLSPSAPSSAALLARSSEHAAVPALRPGRPAATPGPVTAASGGISSPPRPQPTPPATAIRMAASPAQASNEPPPWLDDAPPEEESSASAMTPSARSDAGPAPSPAEPTTTSAPLRPRPAIAALPEPILRTPLGDRWAEVVNAMVAGGDITAMVKELAVQSQLAGIRSVGDDECWALIVERDTLRTTALADKLQASLRGVTGIAGLQLELVSGAAQDSPQRRDTERAAQRQFDAEQAIHADPLVQSLLAQFSTARIVPGSIKPV